MRIFGFVFFWLALVGWSAAQDSPAQISPAQEATFTAGPQYLITSGSPLFARPIAPPSMSFDLPPAEAIVPAATSDVVHEPSDVVLETPPALQGQADLFPLYYGVPPIPVVIISYREPSGGEMPSQNPASSVAEIGVVAMTDVQSVRQHGYGVTVAEASQYWRGHKGAARRVYTNEDIERLRGGI
jgi:hypothetical protein